LDADAPDWARLTRIFLRAIRVDPLDRYNPRPIAFEMRTATLPLQAV